MATYRIGIGSFNLKDGAVGIGTEATGGIKLSKVLVIKMLLE